MTENEKMNDYGMVSIVILSKDQTQYVEESVRSVMAQTYQNSCVPMVASAASVERGIVVCGKNG